MDSACKGTGQVVHSVLADKDAVTHIFFQFPFVRELRIPLAKTSALDFAEAVKTRNEHPFEGCGGEGHTALQTLRRDDLVGSVTHLPKPIMKESSEGGLSPKVGALRTGG